VTGSLTLTVASGAPIQVCGMVFNNTTGTSIQVTINDGDGNKISAVTVPAYESFEVQTNWLADTGLQLVADSTGVYATVFHNSPGN
jgi:hypothetical protein